jgi:hypothetical protein
VIITFEPMLLASLFAAIALCASAAHAQDDDGHYFAREKDRKAECVRCEALLGALPSAAARSELATVQRLCQQRFRNSAELTCAELAAALVQHAGAALPCHAAAVCRYTREELAAEAMGRRGERVLKIHDEL